MKNVFLGIAAIAAVVAIGGVIYFGTGANQQASVANVTEKSLYPKKVKPIAGEGTSDSKTAAPKPVIKPLYDNGVFVGEDRAMANKEKVSIIPTVIYPGLEKEAKAYIDSIAALEKKIQTLNPSTGNERKIYYLGNGICVSTGPLGGNAHFFAC